MENEEKSNAFYLGNIINSKDGKATKERFLYESKNFTTHAICVGMTGSGKTGLSIAVLEEAALDKIPAIIIDPKGDLTNLLLTFPELSSAEFLPWIDPAEAERKGMPIEAYAESVAQVWREGLTKSGEDSSRIKKLRESAEMVIYTPASNAGIPISVLSSFKAPSKEIMIDSSAMRDRIISETSSLMGLIGLQGDPIKSKEHILIAALFTYFWEKGQDLNLSSLIEQIQQPPFSKIGVLDIDTFYPPKERLALSVSLNNLLASPGFKAWLDGDPLDISQLLHSPTGKTKLSIISIAHLADSERMFFVTLLLNELLSWVRQQSGTTNLRALLYMDEIFGYFPPTSVPPSKIPMLTLLKQARAFGLGIMLSTQNPVDIDYKGLSNCGTWFIGKLQTERDKSRILEGLAAASNGEIQTKELDRMIGNIGNRTFILRSIYLKDPLIFQTRWTLSYLRGPLTLAQIEKLTVGLKGNEKTSPLNPSSLNQIKPLLPPGVEQYYLHDQLPNIPLVYQPKILGVAKLHFVDSKNNLDTWKEVSQISSLNEQTVNWEKAETVNEWKKHVTNTPLADAKFLDFSPLIFNKQGYAHLQKSFATYLYQNQVFTLYKFKELNLVSNEKESENEFREKVSQALREKYQRAIEKLESKYADKIFQLNEKIRRSQEKMDTQKKQVGLRIVEAIISFGATILSALLGKKVTKGTISQTGTSIRQIGRVTKENQEASHAEGDFTNLQQQLNDLKNQQEEEMKQYILPQPQDLPLEKLEIRPRKTDIEIETIALIWTTHDN